MKWTVFSNSVAAEMIASCGQKEIPITVNRYVNSNYPAEFRRVYQDDRFSGFILYETASFLRFDDQGGCIIQNDMVAEVCKMIKD